ncbi:TIGR02391 family protein [bacterium]|nr:TIGR02391 family protein [bacterium]
MAPNYRVIATEVGDALKWDSTVNDIDRIGSALFRFRYEDFPNQAITSERAKHIYNWILSLARQKMTQEERDILLVDFCKKIAPQRILNNIETILAQNGILSGHEQILDFGQRNFHPIIVRHCRELFVQGNYFHAVFEACKAYNKNVKEKARSQKDGHPLMLDVWGWEKGVLKITRCESDTDKNIQEGIKFLSAGMMQAIRNPTAHEPALDWPMERQQCLDLLSFLSFLYRILDEATYYSDSNAASRRP